MSDANIVSTRTRTVPRTSSIDPRSDSFEGFARIFEPTNSTSIEEEIKSHALETERKIFVNEIRLQEQTNYETNYEIEHPQIVTSESVEDCQVAVQVAINESTVETDEVQKFLQNSLKTDQVSPSWCCTSASNEIVNLSSALISIQSRYSLPCDFDEESEKFPPISASCLRQELKVEKRDDKYCLREECFESTVTPEFGIFAVKSPESKLSKIAKVNKRAELVSSLDTENTFEPIAQTPRCLFNRYNSASNPILTPLAFQQLPSVTPLAFTTSVSFSHLQRLDPRVTKSTSSVRLSLSLDGKAKLVPTLSSPLHDYAPCPRSMSGNIFSQKRKKSLRRKSIAILPRSSYTEIGSFIDPSMNQWRTGRSRDARMWKLCCDGRHKNRDELTLQAENESYGSAVAAINLIRSASKSKMKSNPKKRDSPASRSVRKHEKKFRTEKSKSKIFGFQNVSSSISLNSKNCRPDYVKDELLSSPSGDSDKENWLPQIHGTSCRRPLPSSPLDKLSPSRKIMGEHQLITSRVYGLDSPKSLKRKFVNTAPDVYEDVKITRIADIERFIRSQVSPSKHRDLGAIQGLLSLSQGNWK